MPYLVFLRAREDAHREAFRRWLAADHGPRIGAIAPGLTRVVATICAASPDGPEGLNLPEQMRLNGSNTQPWPGYDAALTLDGPAAAVTLLCDGELAEHVDLCHAYRVSEKVIIDKGTIHAGRPSNGMTYLRGIHFHDDLPQSARVRSWTLHGGLAVKVHVGVSRYVQWYVDEVLTADAPAIGGVAELHFPSRRDMVEGFFDSPRGRDEIVQDTRHFIAGGPPRLFAEQFVFA